MIVLNELYIDNAYNRFSFLPNVSPRWRQALPLAAIVFKNQVGLLENKSGLKLYNCCPGQVYKEGPIKLDRTKAAGGELTLELINIDLIQGT